jgi:hypothetical protein
MTDDDCLRSGAHRSEIISFCRLSTKYVIFLSKKVRTPRIWKQATHTFFFCQRNMPFRSSARRDSTRGINLRNLPSWITRHGTTQPRRLGYSLFLACRPCSLRLGRIAAAEKARRCCRPRLALLWSSRSRSRPRRTDTRHRHPKQKHTPTMREREGENVFSGTVVARRPYVAVGRPASLSSRRAGSAHGAGISPRNGRSSSVSSWSCRHMLTDHHQAPAETALLLSS